MALFFCGLVCDFGGLVIGVQPDPGAIVALQNEVPDMIDPVSSERNVALVVVFICLRKIAPN